MHKDSRQFLIKIVVLSVVVYALATVLFSSVLQPWYLPSYPYLILLIACVTTIGHLIVIRSSGQNNMKFTTAFMASVTLKLFVYLLFMLVFLMLNRAQVIPFVLTFMTFYVFFTIFELQQVLSHIKKD